MDIDLDVARKPWRALGKLRGMAFFSRVSSR
jgi:hypothetical protein